MAPDKKDNKRFKRTIAALRNALFVVCFSFVVLSLILAKIELYMQGMAIGVCAAGIELLLRDSKVIQRKDCEEL